MDRYQWSEMVRELHDNGKSSHLHLLQRLLRWIVTCVGRQRQVWLIPIADERVGVQVKLWNPLRTRAIPDRFCGDDSRTGAISSVRNFTCVMGRELSVHVWLPIWPVYLPLPLCCDRLWAASPRMIATLTSVRTFTFTLWWAVSCQSMYDCHSD